MSQLPRQPHPPVEDAPHSSAGPAPEAALEEQDLPANPSELTRGLACPSCQKPMSAYPYGGPGNILIQGCADCQLIWLDYGELGRILRSYARLYRHPADERGAKRLSVGF